MHFVVTDRTVCAHSGVPKVAQNDSEGLTLELVLLSRMCTRVFHVYDFAHAVPPCRACVTNFLNPQLTQSAQLIQSIHN